MVEIAEKEKQDIRGLSLEELTVFMKEHGEKTFRAKQIYEWLWIRAAHGFDEMSNLSLELRKKLEEHFVVRTISLDTSQKSNDRTVKSTYRLHDGLLIEGVLIPSRDRITACVSSQVGCSLSCKFCATGYMKRMRNLEAGEIYDQVVEIRNQAMDLYQQPLTNIVLMGMGEPLLNYANVMTAIDRITSPEGLGISPRRITLSTAGVAKMIRKMADDEVRFNLALSLHAANDVKRDQIMGINETNNLEALTDALIYFNEKTGTRITLEYIVFHNFNDTIEDARELSAFARKVPTKINIIEYNPIAEADFLNTTEDRLTAFANFLESKGHIVNVRRSRGKDIDAACGQLANREK